MKDAIADSSSSIYPLIPPFHDDFVLGLSLPCLCLHSWREGAVLREHTRRRLPVPYPVTALRLDPIPPRRDPPHTNHVRPEPTRQPRPSPPMLT